MTVATATGRCLDVGGDGVQLAERGPGYRFDEDVENATARQTDLEGVVVADPVALQHRHTRAGDPVANL